MCARPWRNLVAGRNTTLYQGAYLINRHSVNNYCGKLIDPMSQLDAGG